VGGAAVDGLLASAAVETLLRYIEENAATLTGDLLPSLLDVDSVFREVDAQRLQPSLHDALMRFVQYARTRDVLQLDACWRLLHGLWSSDRAFLSAVLRILFGFEDLVAVRAGRHFSDPEAFIDELRIFRIALREALCLWSDRLQGRYAVTAPTGRDTVNSGLPMRHGFFEDDALEPDFSPPAGEIEAHWAPVDTSTQWTGAFVDPSRALTGVAALGQFKGDRFVGRTAEVALLWERLAAVGAAGAAHQEVVGLRGPDGVGKSRLVARLEENVRQQLGAAPLVLRARASRLFNLPTWPMVQLFRAYFEATALEASIGEKVRRGLLALVEYLPDEQSRQQLLDTRPYLLDLLGDPEVGARALQIDGRTLGLRTHRALVLLVEAIAARAAVETNAPLLVLVEDAEELDNSSWALLQLLVTQVRPRARVMVVLTYETQAVLPTELMRSPGFTEVRVAPLDLGDAEGLLDAWLAPNALRDETRLRIVTGSKGSPLSLRLNLEQLVMDGVLGFEGGRWVELAPLPAGGVDWPLAELVGRRLEAVGDVAREVAEVVAITEDASGGQILEDVSQRRAIDREELFLALQKLARAGLVEVVGAGVAMVTRATHGLVHDELYRQMTQERRRAVHEDAGEVYARLATTSAFPSLAADHLALAGLHGRALHGLLAGIERGLRAHALLGALELCNQAVGLLKALPRDEQERGLYQVLMRREQVSGLLGLRDQQANDLRQLEPLAARVGSEAERAQLAHRVARHALLSGAYTDVRAALAPWAQTPSDRDRLVAALTHWQAGELVEAGQQLEAASSALDATSTVNHRLRARVSFARGIAAARSGDMAGALRDLFDAWRAARRSGDVYGEALTIQALGHHYWTVGRLMDADRLLRRAERLMTDAGEGRARAKVLVQLGTLHASMGDMDEASAFFGAVLQAGEHGGAHRYDHAAAIIGHSRILVSRGRYEEATGIVAQCIKDIGRRGGRHPVLVDLHNALAMTFAVAARGERLVVGALNYAGEAADRATELGYMRGLVTALGIQVRALLALGRHAEAATRLQDLDTAFEAALEREPRLERLRAEVELYRHGVRKAMGDSTGADEARQAAWNELMAQVRCLEGTGFERGFLNNILPHREILQAMERVAGGAA